MFTCIGEMSKDQRSNIYDSRHNGEIVQEYDGKKWFDLPPDHALLWDRIYRVKPSLIDLTPIDTRKRSNVVLYLFAGVCFSLGYALGYLI